MKAYRLLILCIRILLLTAAIVLIFGEPYEGSATWATDFLLQKCAGFICFWIFGYISRHTVLTSN